MPAKTNSAQRPSDSPRFPILCKTWEEVEAIKKKYLKPVRVGPKGQPIYDHDEVVRYIIFPKDQTAESSETF